MTVDPARLARALTLHASEVEPGEWIVTGGSSPHRVDRWGCDCMDARVRSRTCKHVLAVHLHARLRPEVLDALRTVPTTVDVSTPTTTEEPRCH